MKTEFRKLLLMTHGNRRLAIAGSMQKLGLLHIEERVVDVLEETESLIHKQNLIKRLIRLVEARADQTISEHEVAEKRDEEVIKELRKIEEHIEEFGRKIEKLEKKESQLAPWGDYDYAKFEPLKDQGFHIFLGSIDKRKFNQIAIKDAVIEVINHAGPLRYFVVITKQKDIDNSFESFPLPKSSPADLRSEIAGLKEELNASSSSLSSYLGCLPILKQYLIQTEDSIALAAAQNHFQEHFEGKFISISAWFPQSKESDIIQFLGKEQVAWQIRKPEKGENVPVLLKNKRYSRLFEPITKVFELPNYYETDLTPFLAVFYPILFAYCLGDAGYGFVLAAAMGIGYFTFLNGSKQTAILGFILGFFTTVMGFIKSGSLFGIMLLPDHPVGWIRQLAAWVIIPDDSSVVFNAFNVALIIGVIQILTGVIISIYNKIHYEGWMRAIAPFGKLLILTSLIWIFLVDMQGIATLDVLGDYKRYQLLFGVILVVFFHDLQLSVLQRIGGSFMPLFFIFTGILGDILSYVRLFALGLASSVLGLVINQIGLQIMDGGVINIVIGVVFLLFGHILNFGIAGLGSFVHPLRLSFVEFYSNVGFQGKGLPYRPLSKSQQPLIN
ncbi:MAG: V-type ATPase 116kDa subunit family protein [Bacteroidota bacterium]